MSYYIVFAFLVAGILAVAAVSAEGHSNANLSNIIDAGKKIQKVVIQKMSNGKSGGNAMDFSALANGNVDMDTPAPPKDLSQYGGPTSPPNGFSPDGGYGGGPFASGNYGNYDDASGMLSKIESQGMDSDSIINQLEAVKIKMSCPWALGMVGEYDMIC